jgi:glycolate oxidase iron-sulfur subunit
MQHKIPIENFGATGPIMAHAVEKCVHCGFCLPACPTYVLLGEEMDSPRGRIILMKSVLEGDLALDEALPYIDRCLGCLGCVTACPSGVPYGELVAPFRDYANTRRQRRLVEQASRRLALETLPYPKRFRLAAQAGALARPIQGLLPGRIRIMLDMLPATLPATQPLPGIYQPRGERRARVALLAGCVQQALSPEINWATLRVLARNGVEVIIPAGQGCCGALSMHVGEWSRAQGFALNNLRCFPKDVDAILTNAAGCGSGVKEYPLLFQGTEHEELALDFSRRAMDVSVFLEQLGLVPPPPLPQPIKLAYHDACHLAHAQKVSSEPRRLLENILNLTVVSIPEGDLCCGSAGVYNLEQPEIAGQLGARKARHILDTGAQALAAGNIGCLVQLQRSLAAVDGNLPVWHTIQVLDLAYGSREG